MEDGLTHEVLMALAYRLVDDAWTGFGRRTYLHDEDLTHAFLLSLAGRLRGVGWESDKAKLRSFRHHSASEIIEVEPGGSETTGHFLHYMKASVEAGVG
jgi:hypothetical protein